MCVSYNLNNLFLLTVYWWGGDTDKSQERIIGKRKHLWLWSQSVRDMKYEWGGEIGAFSWMEESCRWIFWKNLLLCWYDWYDNMTMQWWHRDLIFSYLLSKLSTTVKVASSNTSCLVAHAWFFRLLMKGIFDPYVLWSFGKKLIS